MILEVLMALTLYITQVARQSESSELISPVPLEATAAPTSTPAAQSTTSPSLPSVLSAATEISSPSASQTLNPTSSPTSTPSATTVIQATATPTASPSTSPSSTPSNTPKPTIKPTDKPSPTATSTERPKTKEISGPEMDALFTKYSEQYKIDREQLRRIAICESKLNINALNKSYGYGGLYQFSAATWKSYRKLIGQDPNPDLRFDPEEAIETAAWMLSTGRAGAWPNCK